MGTSGALSSNFILLGVEIGGWRGFSHCQAHRSSSSPALPVAFQ